VPLYTGNSKRSAMPEPLGPIPVSGSAEAGDRLDSWKEIAAYLGREVRTVQGWEKLEGLPIHRHLHSRQGSVYAFKTEMDAWREARKGVSEAPTPVLLKEAPAAGLGRYRTPLILTACAVAALVILGGWLWMKRPAKSPGSALSSVVVLPFLDLSPQKDQEYFSDGLTEEIIDALSRVPDLHVVARTSAFAFKGKANDIRQIGQQLNVSAVLEGSVRKAGDQLRITAQLNRVSDGTHLWSRTFDRQLRDVFGVQLDISQAIADQLRAGRVPQREPTTNLEAYNRFQEGRYFFNQGRPDSLPKAQERYQRAVQYDPKFALAYAGLADTYAYQAEHMMAAPRQVMPKAKESAEKAVSLNDSLGEAHTSLGIVKLDYEWDRDGAQREFLRAMQLNPGSGYLHHWYAHSLEAQGRLDDALREMRAALALDPLAVIIHWDIANELLMAHRYDDALQQLERSLELFPNHPLLLYFEGWAYHAKNDPASAHRVMETLRTVLSGTPDLPFSQTVFGIEEAWDGRRADAERTLRHLENLRATHYVDAMVVAFLCSALGDRDGLRLWFRRAYDERETLFVYAPIMRGIYFSGGDPQVESLIAKLR
jgi:TolB-like protein/Tfp pilus assembly protein PilF